MTDKELLRIYQKSALKSVAVIRAAEEEKTSLEEIVDRLEKLGKHIRQGMRRAFHVSAIQDITRADINAYLKNNGYRPLDPDLPQAGVVSDYYEKCRFLNRDGTKSCTFYTATKQRRGCPAGDGCIRRELVK